jgi:Na+/proline symporter
MNPIIVISIILGYFLLLIGVSLLTTKQTDSATFFTANRQSPWYLVAFGMIGASLSGVTFISIPGYVGATQFTYFQVVLGYMVGYLVIGTVLLPLYYRLNLTSIYTYLEQRFGFWSYKTGAFFFLLSRTIGSAFRLFLVAGVMQIAIFDKFNIPFWVAVLCTIVLIWLYTFRGGIKTIVYTDTLQTFFMLLAVGITIWIISKELNWSLGEMATQVRESDYSKVFEWDWSLDTNFFRQFSSGAFIAIVMTGLDQDMMQKNLTCRNLSDAQKNMFWFSLTLLFVNILFLTLGALLYFYMTANGISAPARTDDLYPLLALQYFDTFTGIVFLLGITAAAYSSADSALTALTTSFCVDFLGFQEPNGRFQTEKEKKRTRLQVHLGFSLLLFVVIVIFRIINDEAVISSVFKAAGYTYGPLLGLFTFGIIFKNKVNDRLVPWICLASPIISYLINAYSVELHLGKIGFEILIINGLITFLGIAIVSSRPQPNSTIGSQ